MIVEMIRPSEFKPSDYPVMKPRALDKSEDKEDRRRRPIAGEKHLGNTVDVYA
jgi:hypothetical protein